MNSDDKQEPEQSPIMPEAEERRQPVFNPMGRVEQINTDEIKIADVRRHPIGLYFIYIQTIAALGLSLGLVGLLLPEFLKGLNVSDASAQAIGLLFGLVVLSLGVIFVILATRIYLANQLIITNDNVTQVAQVGLFHRKVSELSMENVEDVTAHQKGLFQTLFNYGRLHVETAGEQDNYNFHYCPNPNAYAKAIQDARLTFLKTH
ncbi:MAG: PH domain-containing protein [Candidatus Saccharimonadales bacterium]